MISSAPVFPIRSAYGLSIDSALDLPELMLASESSAHAAADVKIRYGPVAADGLDGGKQLGPYLWTSQAELWLRIPKVARFLIRGGEEIRIDPDPDSDEDSLRVFLLGSCFGALLFQRGLLVLHGNAVQIGNQCMVCVGRSGAGKSTLAAEFLRRGYPISADDVVPVDTDCRALPGFPRIKLWADAAARLEIDTTGLRRIRPMLEKFNYPVARQSVQHALPVRWVYVLGSDNMEDIRLESVPGMERFQPLRKNTYRLSYLEGMGLKTEHLGLIGKLAGRIRLVRAIRPDRGFTVSALADRILADIAGHP